MQIKEPLLFLEDFCEFQPNWVWILTGIARNKENDKNNEFLSRYIIKSKSEIEVYYDRLKKAMDENGVINSCPLTYKNL